MSNNGKFRTTNSLLICFVKLIFLYENRHISEHTSIYARQKVDQSIHPDSECIFYRSHKSESR